MMAANAPRLDEDGAEGAGGGGGKKNHLREKKN